MKILMFCLLTLWSAGCSTQRLPESFIGDETVKSAFPAHGESLHYRLYGEHLNTVPLVLLHGFAGYCGSWAEVAPLLAQRHPVICVDLAGYGRSNRAADTDISVAAQARYVHELLKTLGIGRVVPVGHDIGGAVAQLMAVEYPQSVQSLVLINSAIDNAWPALEVRMLKMPTLGYAAFTLLEQPIWNHMLAKGFHDPGKISDEIRFRYQSWYQGDEGRRRLVRNAQALDAGDLQHSQAEIERLPLPVLMLWADEEKFLRKAPAEALCRQLRHCSFETMSESGHFMPEEAPARVAETILRFIGG